MLKKWIDKQKIVYILHIIKNFYYNATKNPIVFQIRMSIKTQTTPTKSYRGRPPSWLNKTTEEKKYKNLLLSIHNKHYKNIAYHLRRYKSKEDTIIPIILKYLKKEKKIYNSDYEDKMHIIIATICSSFIKEEEIEKREIYLQIDKKELDFAIETNKEFKPLYRTLKEKRLFKIRTENGCFQSARDNSEYPNIQEIQWRHWEYFCYDTPLWKERFDKYKIKQNDEKFLIEFEDEMTTCEDYEDFYEKFYYEPDEQSKEVQERSIAEIPDIDINKWLIDIFNQEPTFELKKNYKYVY